MPRFEVRKLSECSGCTNYDEVHGGYDRGYDNYLVDVQENKIVYTDAGNAECPEDMTLTRDLSLFVTLLNEVVTAKTLGGLLSEAFAAGVEAGVDYEKNIDAWHPSVLSGFYVKDVLVSLGFEQ